ncbi:AIR carboxylase family protein [Candidatus Woesearchaeota archaeon]|nr:AIR carboxylase family protein [Candidatus Woesearchaeota archaeon]
MARLNVIFGSISDEEKVLPGVVRATKNIPELEVVVHYASADNTPVKVETIMSALSSQKGKKVYISGAGMSNVLTGVVRRYAALNDLVIGVPIKDKVTDGESSFLSTAEKPPLNAVLTVGLDNSYAALNIGHRFLNGRFNNDVVVLDNDGINKIQMDELKKCLCDLKIDYKISDKIDKDDIVITVFGDMRGYLHYVDNILRKGSGVQIGVRHQNNSNASEYKERLGEKEIETTGIVSAASYINAVQIVAQLTQHCYALKIIKEKKQAKMDDLNKHRGLLVINGEITKL